MDWSPRSPYINPIENCYRTLELAAYEEGRQFDTLNDVQECLLYE